jgi:hypothetical protein
MAMTAYMGGQLPGRNYLPSRIEPGYKLAYNSGMSRFRLLPLNCK